MLIAEPQFGQNRVSAKGRVGKSLRSVELQNVKYIS